VFAHILALVLVFPASLLSGDAVPEEPAASLRWGGTSSLDLASAARDLQVSHLTLAGSVPECAYSSG
jgi:hypothetical protein